MSDREAASADVQAVRATLLWGVRLALMVAVTTAVYAAVGPGVTHRELIMALCLSAVPTAFGVRAVSAAWVAGWAYRDLFFAGWSLLCIAQVTTVVALDRADGPLAALFFLPLLFVVLSYPRWLVAVLGVTSVVAYSTVAWAQGEIGLWSGVFFALCIAWTGVFALVAATEQRRRGATIASLSLRDPLTGLPNRALLIERLERALDGHADAHQPLAVLFLDLDDFKVVNDSLGHPAGDSLLRQVVERIRDVLRGEHLVARFGGDELVVVCERLRHPAEAVMIAERIAEAIRAEPFVLGDHEHHATASIGVATTGDARVDADTLIRDADAAMYRAKAAGRGRVEIFDELLRRRLVDRMGLERDLRRALDRDELFVVYQPLVSDAHPVPRAEVLVRWRHPERGLVSPLEFVGVAEETGLIHELGERVLRLGCAQAAAWRAEGGAMTGLRISVNVSARQLADHGFPSKVAGILAETGMDPASLVLEITESAVLDDVEETAERLQALRALGVALSLDDFGTGQSSLTSLLRLPLAAIKIDRSFVAGLGENPRNAAVVKALVALAADLGLHTIVEGVETAEQLALLRSIGCPTFQGYFFSPPLEADAFAAWTGRTPQGAFARGSAALGAALPGVS